MKFLNKFELISLSTILMGHMHKVIHVNDGKHRLPYGYLPNKVFNKFMVVCEKRVWNCEENVYHKLSH